MSLKGTISGKQRLTGSLTPRGNDGLSPTIDIAPIEGGTRVTITDINGTKHFDVLGSISKEQIEELIREHLENNPPDFNESDPTVPAWAKQATKPKYTAEEVGALPADSLQPAINAALAQAKASGDFKGDPGQPGQPGEPGKTPEKGKDYFTDADKQEIAEQAAEMVKVPEGNTVELDTTLTASGKAADAKAVGDALNGKLSTKGGTMTGKIVFPTADQNAGFTNSQDMKIFGYGTFNGAMHMRMGDTQYPFQIRGNGERAKYNDSEIALTGDIPTDEHINSLINNALGVIENGTY